MSECALRFNERNHQYRLDDRYAPGVTTIIKGGVPIPTLNGWYARTVAEAAADMPSAVDALRQMGREPMVRALAAAPDERRNVAAARGTEVHTMAVEVIHGRPLVDVPEDRRELVEGYARFIDRYDLQPVLTERSCANRKDWYAGRFDLIGDLGPDRWLLDAKTSAGVYGDTALQVAAYASAEWYLDDGDPTEHPMPHVDRIGVLHITEDGTDLYDMGDIPTAYAEFLAAKVIHGSTGRRRALTKRGPLALEDVLGAPVLADVDGGLF